MGCIIPYSPTVTIYGVKKTDKNVFFSKSDSLKTRFHNHGNIYIYSSRKRKKFWRLLVFSTQHLRFLKAFKALLYFPKERGIPSPPFQITRLQN